MAMMDFPFATMTDTTWMPRVLEFMHGLYTEDAPSVPLHPAQFPVTIHRFLAEPHLGRVVLFFQADTPCGYALLVPYWSNEYGGTLLHVDELYVAPAARNCGLAHHFFAFLAETRPYGAVALALEVSPANERARRLYESLGFAARRNSFLTRRLEP